MKNLMQDQEKQNKIIENNEFKNFISENFLSLENNHQNEFFNITNYENLFPQVKNFGNN